MPKSPPSIRKTVSPPSPSATRKIFFYRYSPGIKPSGAKVPYNLSTALSHIDTLPYTKDGRYSTFEDDTHCIWIHPSASDHCVKFGKIRRTYLPLEEDGAGKLGPLSIPTKSGLAELTHMRFFPDNIIGAVHNFYGPRPVSLVQYLHSKAPDHPIGFSIQPLLRLNAANEIDRLKTIRLFSLRIHPSYAQIVAEANKSLGAAFEAAFRATSGNTKELEVTLKAGRKKSSDLGPEIRSTAQWLAERPDLRENSNDFSVKGLHSEQDRVHEVDLLADRLVATKRILRQNIRSRALDDVSAFAAIGDAYSELKGELQAAVGIQIV